MHSICVCSWWLFYYLSKKWHKHAHVHQRYIDENVNRLLFYFQSVFTVSIYFRLCIFRLCRFGFVITSVCIQRSNLRDFTARVLVFLYSYRCLGHHHCHRCWREWIATLRIEYVTWIHVELHVSHFFAPENSWQYQRGSNFRKFNENNKKNGPFKTLIWKFVGVFKGFQVTKRRIWLISIDCTQCKKTTQIASRECEWERGRERESERPRGQESERKYVFNKSELPINTVYLNPTGIMV